jgi:hypothetical protein
MRFNISDILSQPSIFNLFVLTSGLFLAIPKPGLISRNYTFLAQEQMLRTAQ